jgi:uncharacterized OsmC-like protein
MRNGINIASISELVQEIRSAPIEGCYRYSVRVSYRGGAHLRGQVLPLKAGSITAGRNFSFDIAAGIGAVEPGMPAPEDLFLSALGGCMMLTAVMGFTTRKVSLSSMTLDLDVRPPGEGIGYRLNTSGSGSDELSQTVLEQVSNFSPNFRTIADPGAIALAVSKDAGGDGAVRAAARTNSRSFSARCQWDRALQVDVESGAADENGKRQLRVDVPKQIGGIDNGPNPQEYLLLGLGACVLRELLADGERPAMDAVEIDVSGLVDLRGMMGIDDQVPPRVQEISCSARVAGPADEERYRAAFEAALARSRMARLIREPQAMDAAQGALTC